MKTTTTTTTTTTETSSSDRGEASPCPDVANPKHPINSEKDEQTTSPKDDSNTATSRRLVEYFLIVSSVPC
eukprot:3571245-Ditylum_brightwellii.AAC.1